MALPSRSWRALSAFAAGAATVGLLAAALTSTMSPGDSLAVSCSGPSLSWTQNSATTGTANCATNPPAPAPSGSALIPASTYRLTDAGTTQSFAVAAGDTLVVKAFTEDAANLTLADPTSSGAAVTWSRAVVDTTSGFCGVYLWTGNVTAAGNVAVTVAKGSSTSAVNSDALVERWSGARPSATKADARGTGVPSAQVASSAGSAVTWTTCDWNAVNDSSAAYTAGTTAEAARFTAGAMSGEYATTAGAASTSVGETAPTGRKWTLVGVEMSPSGTPTPTPTATPTQTPTPAPTPTSTAPTPTPTASGGLPAGVTLKAIDGGQGYYAKWSTPYPGATTMFPITRWAAEGCGTADDSTLINTYLEAGYMSAGCPAAPFYGIGGNNLTGQLVTDEVDQWAGDGWGGWTGVIGFGHDGQVCTSKTTDCGYTAMKSMSGALPSTKFKYTNFGKFAGTQGDATNWKTFSQFTDIASTDVYFFQETGNLYVGWWGVTNVIVGDQKMTGDLSSTDPRLHLSRNYGRLIWHERNMQGGDKPIYSFHELVDMNGNPVDPAAFTAGLWSAVIEGARGVDYFTHNYIATGGQADSFEDPKFSAVKAAAQSFYTTAEGLAPVLNGDDAVNLVSSSADQKTPDGMPAGAEYLAKWNGGKPYLFTHWAGDAAPTGSVTYTLAGSWSSVTVVGENRTIPVVGGKFADSFANQNTVHIYQVNP